MFSLRGKRALVTGAGSGIGESIAQTFAQAGAYVYVADVNAETARNTAGRIESAGGTAEVIILNVADSVSCEAAAWQVTASAALDILVNNAGIGHVGTILTTDGANMDALYNVNVRGVFNMCKAFMPAMIERRSGNVINMASVGGVVGLKDRLAYVTSKYAVVGITKAMALDHAMEGVRVNCICPGRVETPFVQQRLKEYPDPAKAYAEMAASQAVGRMGRPDEIAAAALYLAADESSFITGTAFLIDGGLSAGK